MKPERICLRLAIVVAALLCAGVISAYGADLDVSAVSFKNNDGIINALSANEEVQVSLDVTNEGNEAQDLFFLVQLFKNSERIDYSFERHTVNAGGTKAFSITLTMPSDVSDCYLEATLWDDLKKMNPLCNLGTFPSGDTSVKSFLVNDSAITINAENKNAEDIFLSTNKEYPKIKVTPLDNSTSAAIANPILYPGSSIVTLTAANGAELIYEISYKSSKAIAENLVYIGPPDSSDGVPYTDNSAIVPAFMKRTSEENGTSLFQGYDAQVTDVALPDGYSIEGMPYISTSWNYNSFGSGNEAANPLIVKTWYDSANSVPFFTVDLNYTAELILLSYSTTPRFVANDNLWSVKPQKGNGAAAAEQYYLMFNNRYNNTLNTFSRMATKTITVGGGGPEKITLYNGNAYGYGYVVFFAAKYDVEE